MSEIASEIGERLRAARKQRGWTQQKLAELSGVLERVEVVAVETGKNKASSARARDALAHAFGVSTSRLVAYLIDGTMSLGEFATPVRTVEPEVRYAPREAAIRGHIARGVAEAAAREAADATAIALDADVSPDEFWWFEQIDARLKAQRPFHHELGVRVMQEDDTAAPAEPRRRPKRRTKPVRHK